MDTIGSRKRSRSCAVLDNEALGLEVPATLLARAF
jgi:hypothetical protein